MLIECLYLKKKKRKKNLGEKRIVYVTIFFCSLHNRTQDLALVRPALVQLKYILRPYSHFIKVSKYKLSMMVHANNPNIWEVEAGASPGI